MAKKAKKPEEVVLEREGIIMDGSPVMNSEAWISHSKYIRDNHDVASAALNAGYELGDRIKYKIIVEPKR